MRMHAAPVSLLARQTQFVFHGSTLHKTAIGSLEHEMMRKNASTALIFV